jgi:L-threonylcarbamoyladenylate synthase
LVLDCADVDRLVAALAARGLDSAGVHLMVHSRVPAGWDPARVAVVPHDPEAYARALYAEWHRCDAAGATAIVMETLPAGPEWAGVRDRVKRASA